MALTWTEGRNLTSTTVSDRTYRVFKMPGLDVWAVGYTNADENNVNYLSELPSRDAAIAYVEALTRA